MDTKSCGNCKHFEEIEDVNWGICHALVPAWALTKEVKLSGVVCKDGGAWDVAEDCAAYEKATQDELADATPHHHQPSEMARVASAALFVFDFYTMPTAEFARRYGSMATEQDVVHKLREALIAAGYVDKEEKGEER